MLAPIILFVLIGCLGLLAALRPELYARYCLAEFQRRALSGNFKALSSTGWVIFGGCMTTAIALLFRNMWTRLFPRVGTLFFLICAAAYAWWGIALLRKPDSFLQRTVEPWNRISVWALKIFGVLLLLGAGGFVYGFFVSFTSFGR